MSKVRSKFYYFSLTISIFIGCFLFYGSLRLLEKSNLRQNASGMDTDVIVMLTCHVAAFVLEWPSEAPLFIAFGDGNVLLLDSLMTSNPASSPSDIQSRESDDDDAQEDILVLSHPYRFARAPSRSDNPLDYSLRYVWVQLNPNDISNLKSQLIQTLGYKPNKSSKNANIIMDAGYYQMSLFSGDVIHTLSFSGLYGMRRELQETCPSALTPESSMKQHGVNLYQWYPAVENAILKLIEIGNQSGDDQEVVLVEFRPESKRVLNYIPDGAVLSGTRRINVRNDKGDLLFHKTIPSDVFVALRTNPTSSDSNPQVSDAISGENSESEQIDTMKSVDSLDEK